MNPLTRVQRLAHIQLVVVMLFVVIGVGANPRLLRIVGFWLIPALLNYYVSRTGNLRIVAIMLNLIGLLFSGVLAASFLDAPYSNSIRITGVIASSCFALLWLVTAVVIGLLPRDAGVEPMYRTEDDRME